MKYVFSLLIPAALWSAVPARADIKPMALFSSHAVLQEGQPVPVWGTATPGEKVTVSYGSQTQSATTGTDGRWTVTLTPLKSGLTGKLTMQGKNTVVANDVITGDVWLCSGQSNMGRTLGLKSIQADPVNAAAIKAGTDPQLRLFRLNKVASAIPEADVVAHWELCTPQSLYAFSAVAYYFGRDLRAHLQKPIGLIESAVGGTPAEAWTSLPVMQKDPALVASMAELKKKMDKESAGSGPVVVKSDNGDDHVVNMAIKKPGSLFNAMIVPLIPYAIKGTIWYQGESNSPRANYYHRLLSAMITDWRSRWNQGNFPFLIVQLARFGGVTAGVPFIQEAQLQTLDQPNTGLAVANDIGDPTYIHPADKVDVGHRLALAARHLAYGEDLVYSGPIFDKVKFDGNSATLTFTQMGSGLVIGSAPWLAPKQVAIPTTSLVGFTVADDSHKWSPADAKIVGNTVVVTSSAVPKPVAVRYAWGEFGNLYNKEALPASPFRTDSFPPETNAKPRTTPGAE